MAKLKTNPNVATPDDVYEMLVAMVEGCDLETALLRTNKLVLALANHIGDDEIIAKAVSIAVSDSS